MLDISREQSGKSHFSVIFESGNGKGKVGNPTFEFPVAGLPGRYMEDSLFTHWDTEPFTVRAIYTPLASAPSVHAPPLDLARPIRASPQHPSTPDAGAGRAGAREWRKDACDQACQVPAGLL